MKIRLEGTNEEIKWVIQSLCKIYSVTSESKLYKNRDNVSCRCYVELTAFFIQSGSDLDSNPTESNQPKPWDVVRGGDNNE
jgi:hypothetical protein